MKIKHKVSGLTLEGSFTYDGMDYRDTGTHGYSLYHNSQWEEVTEWKDVTRDCHVECHGMNLAYINKPTLEQVLWCVSNSNYRLRKVSGSDMSKHPHAFIVERRPRD